MATETSLPSEMRALVHETKGEPLRLQKIPTPTAVHGSAVIKVLATLVHANMPKIFAGEIPLPHPLPMVPGDRCVGRIAATGPDTTSLSVGQLVVFDPWVFVRDSPRDTILMGAFGGWTPALQKWTGENWRNAGLAEYMRAPLENCWALNEQRLCGELGYTPVELLQLTITAVGFGGLRGINLEAGQRVIVAPATGLMTGATVAAAVAMGASVVAASRNMDILRKIQGIYPDQVNIVQLTGDGEKDTANMKQFGPVDAFLDMSPTTKTTHFLSAVNALRTYGKVSIMGGFPEDLKLSELKPILKQLTIRGQGMYPREDFGALVQMAEAGVLKLGERGGGEIVGRFKLEEIEKAFECVGKGQHFGQLCVVEP